MASPFFCGRHLIPEGTIRHGPSQAQINGDVFKDLCVSLEAGGKDEVPAVGGNHRKGARRLDVHLLEALKEFLVLVPKVNLRKGVVASQSQVVPFFEGERLQRHGTSGRNCLDLGKLFGAPPQNFGVADVSRQSQVQLLFDPEVLDSHYIFHVWNFSLLDELLAAPNPLVNHRNLRAARQNQMGLSIQV